MMYKFGAFQLKYFRICFSWLGDQTPASILCLTTDVVGGKDCIIYMINTQYIRFFIFVCCGIDRCEIYLSENLIVNYNNCLYRTL